MNGWINVEKKPPPIFEPIHIYVHKHEYGKKFNGVFEAIRFLSKEYEYYIISSIYFAKKGRTRTVNAESVLFWRPLPPPPQIEIEDEEKLYQAACELEQSPDSIIED